MISLSAVGDISLGDSAKCLGFGVRSWILKRDVGHPFEHVREAFGEDIVFGNLETVLSRDGMIRGDFDSEHLRGIPESVCSLRDAGFNVLNVANNHAMQHGPGAFNETVEKLRSNGITVVGLRGNDGYCSLPAIHEAQRRRIGFLGYSCTRDPYCPEDRTLYALCGDRERILSDVTRFQKKVDWLVVSMHWGIEFMNDPSIATVRLARDIVDAGANVILGHHPHVLQGVERYNNALIFYSLGNFVFDMMWDPDLNRTMIARLALHEGGTVSWKAVPIIINDRCQPSFVTGREEARSIAHLEQLSERIEREVVSDPEHANLAYYLEYERRRRRDSIRSNLYLLKTLHRTGRALLPGKIGYLLRKLKIG